MKRTSIVPVLAAILLAGCVKNDSRDASDDVSLTTPAAESGEPVELDDAEIDGILAEVDVLTEDEAARKAESEIDASNADAEFAKLVAEIEGDG